MSEPKKQPGVAFWARTFLLADGAPDLLFGIWRGEPLPVIAGATICAEVICGSR
jgi:hypothetical protein